MAKISARGAVAISTWRRVEESAATGRYEVCATVAGDPRGGAVRVLTRIPPGGYSVAVRCASAALAEEWLTTHGYRRD